MTKINGILELDKVHPGGILIVPNNFIWMKPARTAGSSMLYGIIKPNFSTLIHHTKYNTHQYRPFLEDLNEDNIDKHFKFVFVRNPWERLVSFYFWTKGNKYVRDNSSTFAQFVSNFDLFIEKNSGAFYEHSTPLCTYSHHEGNQFVDFIGRFENLEEDFNYVCDKIGIPHQSFSGGNLRHNRTEHEHYSRYYDAETYQFVLDFYKKDIEYFGYRFEQN